MTEPGIARPAGPGAGLPADRPAHPPARPSPAWTAAGATARVELRRWVRQPQAVAAALLAPVAVASLVSLALGGEPEVSGTVAVVDLDGGPAAAAFVDDALGEPRVAEVLTVRDVDTRVEAARLVEDGTVAAAVVLPDGLTEGIVRGSAAPEVLRADDPSISADLVELVAEVFRARARAEGEALAVSGRGLPTAPALTVAPTAPGGQALDAATHFGPAIGLFFVMLALSFAVDGQVADRRRGIVDRVAASPAPAAAVAAGRSLAALAVGCASLLVTAATMQLAFGRGWGPATSVTALAVAVAFACAGIAAVVAGVVRTPGQAQGLTVALAFGMALAGGTFTPPGSSAGRPPLAGLLPTTLALDGFGLTTTEGAGLGALGPHPRRTRRRGVGRVRRHRRAGDEERTMNPIPRATPPAPGRPRPAGGAAVAMAMVQLLWRRLRRDPVGLIFTLVVPLAVAVVMGVLYSAEASGPGTVGVLADRSDPVADDLVARLDANVLLDVRAYADREALDDAVRHRRIDGGIVVPTGLGPALDRGTIELVGPPGIAAPSGLRAAVEATVAETAAAVQLGAVLAPDDRGEPA